MENALYFLFKVYFFLFFVFWSIFRVYFVKYYTMFYCFLYDSFIGWFTNFLLKDKLYIHVNTIITVPQFRVELLAKKKIQV